MSFSAASPSSPSPHRSLVVAGFLVSVLIALSACAAPSTLPFSPDVSPPSLAKLQVSLTAHGPDIQLLHSQIDALSYAVTCDGSPSLQVTAPDTVTVVISALDGSDASIPLVDGFVTLPPSSRGFLLSATTQMSDPTVLSDRAVTARIRCLPADFPKINISGKFSDWLLLTALQTANSASRSSVSYSMLLDPSGFPMWFNRTPSFFALADLFVDAGSLVKFSNESRPFQAWNLQPSLGFSRVGFDGKSSASWVLDSDLAMDMHAAEVLPNGNLLTFVYERTVLSGTAQFGLVPPASQGAMSCPSATPRPGDAAWFGRVVEVSPNGTIAQEWSLPVDQAALAFSPLWWNVSSDPAVKVCELDVEHLNALDFISAPGGDTVLITGRHFNGAILLDWPSGNVRWRLGGKIETSESLTILNDPLGGPVYSHDTNFTALPGSSNSALSSIILFDNRILEPSRVVVYRIDSSLRTATLTDSFALPCVDGLCYAFAMGSARLTAAGTGVLAGGGASTLAAAEFKFGAADPVASLLLPGFWTYRVLPVSPFVPAELFVAQDAFALRFP